MSDANDQDERPWGIRTVLMLPVALVVQAFYLLRDWLRRRPAP